MAGLSTNVPFLLNLAGHPQFIAADVHTGFISQHQDSLFPTKTLPSAVVCQAGLAISLLQQQHSLRELLSQKGISLHKMVLTKCCEVLS